MTDSHEPPYQPSPYEQPPGAQQSIGVAAGYVAPVVPKGLSVTSMVLGLVSIVFGFTFVVPITGLVLGILGTRREPFARGFSLAGIILNGLMLLGWVVLVIVFFAIIVLGVGAAAVSGSISG